MLPHTSSSSTAGQVLSTAADIMTERGWQQGSWGSHAGGPVCVEGAIAEAGLQLGLQPQELAEPMTLVRQTVGGSIPAWNDSVGRTRQQAVDLLQICSAAIDASSAPSLTARRPAPTPLQEVA